MERSRESLGGKARIHAVAKHPGGSFREKVSELLRCEDLITEVSFEDEIINEDRSYIK